MDRDRLGIARDEMKSMLQEEELKEAVLMVFANKQDMPGSFLLSNDFLFINISIIQFNSIDSICF